MSKAAEIRLAAVVRGCSDSRYWYANKIGEQFELYAPYTGGGLTVGDGWRVWTGREVNFINLADAEVVPTRNGERILREELPPAPEAEPLDYRHTCHNSKCVQYGEVWDGTRPVDFCPGCKQPAVTKPSYRVNRDG